jgi:FkbH-like protein
VQRTNQLNFSGNRYAREDLAALLAAGEATISVVMGCEDRFGSYGIVGFSLLRAAGKTLEMTDLMLSCRIQGKKIEHSYLAHLAGVAKRIGMDRLACRYNRTARNASAARVFEDLGFRREIEGGNREVYTAECRAIVMSKLPATIVDEMEIEARLRRMG